MPPGGTPVKIEDGDVVIFVNYRSDRARQLTQAFIDDDFDGFERKSRPKIHSFVSLTQYNKKFDIPVAFRAGAPEQCLRRIYGAPRYAPACSLAETEKYAHVTFFFNGGREEPFEGEDRILVPSPQVATYDLCPEMSAEEVTRPPGGGDRRRQIRRHHLQLCQY